MKVKSIYRDKKSLEEFYVIGRGETLAEAMKDAHEQMSDEDEFVRVETLED